MKVDNCLILCAGKGTRMGEVGRDLPKPLWPIFEKTMLELQIQYAKSLGAQRIFVNAFHQKEKIVEFIKKNNFKVEVLIEEKLLGTGGAVHNLAEYLNYSGKLLILNSDQFYFVSEKVIENALEIVDTKSSCLFGIKVSKDSKYNRVYTKNSLITSIGSNNSENDFYTYSGTGVVNLTKLSVYRGESSFFDTVADYRNDEVVLIEDDFDYWDFGTLPQYKELLFSIIKKINSGTSNSITNFLINNNAIQMKKINSKDGYNSEGKGMSFVSDKIAKEGEIVLKEGIIPF